MLFPLHYKFMLYPLLPSISRCSCNSISKIFYAKKSKNSYEQLMSKFSPGGGGNASSFRQSSMPKIKELLEKLISKVSPGGSGGGNASSFLQPTARQQPHKKYNGFY
ncbi:hypothetical protein SAY86_027185 [Trapa natans]|uniref:Uncharacterized protein n=1 Tax=Trapa natans TaxID=22666 RepID=A0AAN7KLW4_TRANT|nr:hypothetical protein SAY86_027185 [Trapa natans]